MKYILTMEGNVSQKLRVCIKPLLGMKINKYFKQELEAFVL